MLRVENLIADRLMVLLMKGVLNNVKRKLPFEEKERYILGAESMPGRYRSSIYPAKCVVYIGGV